MTSPPSGPGAADWLAGLLRGFHPLRWLLCLVGLVLTGLSAVVAKSFFDQRPPDLPGWWQQPIEHAQALRAEILGGSLGRIIAGGGALLALNTALWSFIGGWIARHELLARRRGRYDAAEVRLEPSPTAFLIGWWKILPACCPCVLMVALPMLMPVVLASWVNAWFGGLGALVVSLLLPVVLVADLLLVVFALGAVAWPLIPITLAAECSDSFDAVSRCYSYVLQRSLRFLLLTATALGLAWLPSGILYAFAEQMTAWQPEARQTAFLLAATLSVSIFWSLQTLVYLHLRLAIDEVDASEVAIGPPPRETPKTPSPEGKAAELPASGDTGPARRLRGLIVRLQLLAAAVGSWCLTFWLFTRASSGKTEWLGWGLGETFLPRAEGVYRVASVIAGLWGVVWLALPLVWAGRRRSLVGAPGRAEQLPGEQH
jgi:hypothetical protein